MTAANSLDRGRQCCTLCSLLLKSLDPLLLRAKTFQSMLTLGSPRRAGYRRSTFLFRLVKLDLVQGPPIHQPAVVSSLLSFLLKVEHPFFNSIFADVVVVIISINDHDHHEQIDVIFVFPQ